MVTLTHMRRSLLRPKQRTYLYFEAPAKWIEGLWREFLSKKYLNDWAHRNILVDTIQNKTSLKINFLPLATNPPSSSSWLKYASRKSISSRWIIIILSKDMTDLNTYIFFFSFFSDPTLHHHFARAFGSYSSRSCRKKIFGACQNSVGRLV